MLGSDKGFEGFEFEIDLVIGTSLETEPGATFPLSSLLADLELDEDLL